MYTATLRDSEQLKTTFALYNKDTVQKDEPATFTRLKNMVKKFIDLKTKDRNFDASNDSPASGDPIRRKGDDRKMRRQKTRGL